MYGNLINNRQLKSLIDSKSIEIDPFNESNLSTVHYTLHVNKIKEKMANGNLNTIWNFTEKNYPFPLKAGGYVIVEIFEKIRLNDENIIGHFIPTSNLIEEGLLIVSGKIDKNYGSTGPNLGKQNEMVIFGLKNLTNSEIQINPHHRIAHLELFDLRGVSSEKMKLSDEEIRQRLNRLLKAYDGGVFYDEGNE